jgi:hypothetical protein
MFEREEVEGIRGLTSLTEPGPEEPVGAVVDVAVIGARGDGKTQFIVHAIRSLRAYAPLLEGAEHQYNRDALQVVLNAREPRPDATTPGVVPHYVFRIRPGSLLSQVGFGGRLRILTRAAGLGTYLVLALLNAAALAGALFAIRGAVDAAVIAAPIAALVVGAGLGWLLARRRFARTGEIEIVFWDVAGEHVYSDSAADYYSFLAALVRQRRERTTATRGHAFAPVLICNPLSLGTHEQGSSYARLRKLIPLFASLEVRAPKAMVAINRWSVVERVCEPDSDREELVAVVPQNRADLDPDRPPSEPAAPATDPLPVVRREVLRRLCLDAEDGSEVDVRFTYLRYDAGMQCEFRDRSWKGWDQLDDGSRRRWRAPTTVEPSVAVDYIYEEGPGSFEGRTRRRFLGWLADLAYPRRSQRAPVAAEPATAEPTRSPEESGEIVPLVQVKESASTSRWRKHENTSPGYGPQPPTASVSLGGSLPPAGSDDDDEYPASPTGGFRSGGT